ncbi:MAG: hypothetical protein CMP75_00320 [Flavobacteriales bacterium]|nr:hypothetical protein [Flavobacteriales bacterium]|tara:strand:+ start:282 stop:797 length:516 start_codon:yes stop_codon:yes gene_type:complete
MRKFAMNYGAIMGLILVAFSIVLEQLGIDPINAKWVTIINYIVYFIFIIYGTYIYREQISNGFISYSIALKLGTSIVFFATIISSFYVYVYAEFINPDMIVDILLNNEEQIYEANPNISDEEMEVAISIIEKFSTPIMLSLIVLLQGTLIGFVFSLLTSAFLKRNKPEFEA